MPSEVEVARPVVAHFRGLGEVFPEVTCWAYGDRADLVCRRPDGTLDVCEVKVAPSLKLRRQIGAWASYADRAWVAYVPPRRGAVSERWSDTFRRDGIGVIHVYGGTVTVRVDAVTTTPSAWHRDRLAGSLSPLHSTYAEAGNADGHYLTAFRITCDNLRELVRARPGVTMKEAVGAISHHYTSDKVARSSLLRWIRDGKIDGVATREREGERALGLYAVELSKGDHS